MTNLNLTPIETDSLKEVINIGAGNAATALSQILNKNVQMTVPGAFISKIEKAYQNFPDKQKIVTAILLQITGDIPGLVFYLMPSEDALNLAGILTGNHKKDFRVLDDIDRSSLKEAGNMIAGATVTSLSKFLDKNMMHSIPDVATDTVESITNSLIIEMGQASDSILILNVGLDINDEKLSGQLYFMFPPQSTEKILQITKEKIGE